MIHMAVLNLREKDERADESSPSERGRRAVRGSRRCVARPTH